MSQAPGAAAPLIALHGVAIGHGRRRLHEGLELEVRGGETLALVGPNGAGKSTLLHTLLGMQPALAGTVTRRAGLTLGFVPQRGRHDPIFPLRTIDVVATGGMGARTGAGWLKLTAASHHDASALLAELGLTDQGPRPFRDLSGGQQRRALIARALVRRPDLLVLDEPTAGMDLPSEHDLMALVARLASAHGVGVIFVTHDLSLAARNASRIALMSREPPAFAVDTVEALLTGERLGRLYGRAMDVQDAGGAAVVRVAAGPGGAP